MELLSLAEAASRLGLSVSTLQHQARDGRIRATLIGKTYVIEASEVDRYRATSLGRPGRHASTPSTPDAAPTSPATSAPPSRSRR